MMSNSYNEMGQFLRESFSLSNEYKRVSKKLTESKEEVKESEQDEKLTEGYAGAGYDLLNGLMDYIDEHELLVSLIAWLPDDTLKDFAYDLQKDYDIDPDMV